MIRPDIFHLSRFATDRGLRVILSTNGTMITPEVARSIKESGMQYAGVSLDGLQETHDEFRCMPGALDRALEGIRNCMELGIKTGIRFTVNKLNREDLPGVIELLEREGIPRFCMYHLVYSGRGREMVDMDTSREQKLETIRFLVDKTIELHEKGVETELLTVDNHADGVYIYNYLTQRNPERADEVMQLLKMHGGCSAGTKFANVDPLGNVHPCQFWQHVTLGNVRDRKFSQIWNDKDIPIELKPTCAPQFMRIARQKGMKMRFTRGCIAGITYCLIGPTGDVQPCAYLDMKLGNVREEPFTEIWQNSPVFARLRSMDYRGSCGICEYKDICGGCRARAAYYHKGDYMASESWCTHKPSIHSGSVSPDR